MTRRLEGARRAALAVAWAAGMAAAAPPEARAAFGADSLLGPISVIRPARGPLLVVRAQPESGLVALRLAVRASEPAGLEGAARVLVELARPALEAAAGAAGARVSVERTPTHVVYRVVGRADDFERLVALLRRGLAAPSRVSTGQLGAAQVQARARAAAEWDTPDALLRTRLRAALFPGLAEDPGGGSGLALLTPERLARWWAWTSRPDRVAVVVAGGVDAARVAAAFEDWPAARRAAQPERGAAGRRPTPSAPAPQVVARRVGLAYPAAGLEPATLAVAAALMEQHLTRSGQPGARVEAWWSGERRALVLLGSERVQQDGAAARGSGSLRERLESAIAGLGAGLTATEVLRIRRRLVRDVLFAARTAEGMAEVLGEMLDRTGEPQAALRFVAALQQVDPRRVRDALRSIAAATPEVVEVAP